MTCSPRQAEFIKVVNTSLGEDGVRKQIDKIEYHLDASFPEKLYDSCKGVQGLAPGQMLLDLMCGPWGSRECNGKRWLAFSGESVDDNGQSPFAVQHIYYDVHKTPSSKAIVPYSPPSYPCWQKPSPKDLPCSCNDCEETCRRRQLPEKAKYLPPDTQVLELMGMTGSLFTSLLMFVSLVSLILTYFLMKAYQRKRTQNRKLKLQSSFSERN